MGFEPTTGQAQRICNPSERSRSSDNNGTCSGDSSTATNSATNAAQNGPDLAALADALAALPEADRPAVVAHVAALARLAPAKRTAILTLTDSNEGKNET